jgi:hypothetical protein
VTHLDYRHPFERRDLLGRMWPFVVVMALSWLLLPLFGSVTYVGLIALAAVLNVVLIALVVLVPWARVPNASIIPPMLWLVVVMLLRAATHGTDAGYSPLVLLTIFWASLFGTRWMVWIACLGTLVAIGAPPLLTDTIAYPDTDFRRAILYTVIGCFIGLAIQTTVEGLRLERERTAELEAELTRRRAFELNDDVVQDLAIAKLSLEAGRPDDTHAAIARALDAGKRIISEMVDATGRFERAEPSGPDAPATDT